MYAYPLTQHGSTRILQLREIDEPTPQENQVKVSVERIGINYAEILSRRGQYRWAPPLPYVPGMEAFGTIEELGENVDNKKVGDKVIIVNQHGAYAEKMIAPEHLVFSALDHFTPEENAAYVVNFITAWVALMKLARIQESDHVLINAAAGGVGTAAVQIAKSMGCTVFGTASKPDKIALLKGLQADYSINYRKDEFDKIIRNVNSGKGVDVVLELVGGKVFRQSKALLNPFGKMVIAGVASLKFNRKNPFTWFQAYKNRPQYDILEMAQASQGIMATHIGYLINDVDVVQRLWEELTTHTHEHQMKPVIGKIINFEDLPEAHRFIESRKSYGKVVVKL